MGKMVKTILGWVSAHPHSIVFTALGLLVGVLLKFPSGWTPPDPMASVVGAFAGAAAAVGGALWAANAKQHQEDAKVALHEHRIAAAIAPALIGDLNVAAHVLRELKDNAFKLTQSRVAHHEEFEQALKSVTRIRLNAFDRFNDLLPLLGKESAPIVIECYATILRTVTMIREELETKTATMELKEALATMAKNADQLSKRVADAKTLLELCSRDSSPTI